jgi:hypothetical protein
MKRVQLARNIRLLRADVMGSRRYRRQVPQLWVPPHIWHGPEADQRSAPCLSVDPLRSVRSLAFLKRKLRGGQGSC